MSTYRSVLLTLAILAGGVGCSSRQESASAALQSPRADCSAANGWVAGHAYEAGDRVQNHGNLYECRPHPATGWCADSAYEPGGTGGGGEWWPSAWIDHGTCTVDDIDGNELVLVLPAAPAGSRRDGAITGTLRCPGEVLEEHPITGDWGQELRIDGLRRCDYHLILNVAGGSRPLNTPAIISFSEEEKQSETFNAQYAEPLDLSGLVALPGLKVELFAQGLIQPRQMALGKNVLYVGSSRIPYAGEASKISEFVYALPLDPTSGKPTGLHLLATGLIEPHGVAYRNGDLYYATTGDLYRVRDADATYQNPLPERVLRFPADDKRFPLPPMGEQGGRQWHQKHPLHFNPLDPEDNALYTAVGIPCNICMVEKDERYGSILKYDLTTGAATVLARGVRNSVGFDWNPETGQIWFSDNNRQNFTNADEINVVTRQNQHFGVPYVFGKETKGYTQAEWEGTSDLPPNQPYLVRGAILADMPPGEISPRRYTAPALALGSNTAPLGIKFVGETFYPGALPGSQRMLVALHSGGTNDTGIDVRMMTVIGSQVVSVVPLVTGWRQPTGNVSGRPVDFLPLADGSVLISDDIAGVIYRVSYDSAGVPDTRVSLTMAAAPDPSLSGEVPVGYLTDPQGRRRRLELGWSGPVLNLPGLPYGHYVLEMADVGAEWTPVEPRIEFDLSPESPIHSISLGYRGIPDIDANVRITAPSRPAGGSLPAQWVVTLVNVGSGVEREIPISWGDSVIETLGYGTYELISPYQFVALPEPAKARFSVTTDGDQNAPTMGYRAVADIGAALLAAPSEGQSAGACWGCHKSGFKSPSIAYEWQENGRTALVAKIRSMSDRIAQGHCDGVCAGAVADHLFNDVWPEYLNPGDPFGTRQLRKLSSADYVNAVKDVLNVQVDADYLPDEGIDRDFGYPGQANRGLLGKSEVLAYYTEAMRVAKAVDLDGLGYQPGHPDAFVAALGRRLFRRPLNAAELTRYKALLEREGEAVEGPRLMIAGMLSSNNFLYRSELGVKDASRSKEGDVYRLTPNELATALSFGFLGTTPSDALLDKAEAGQLETEEQIAAEIDAMLTTERGKAQFLRFIRYYTRTYGVVPEKPGLDRTLINTMEREQEAFVLHVISDPNGTFDELFNPGYTYLNQSLAQHYGISGVSGDEMQKKDVDDKRGGLLHQAIVHATQSGTETTSLVRRGFLVREQMFCRQFGTMENDNRVPQFPDRPVSTRERMSLINGPVNPSCWTCHQFVNDLGASFENYDAIGRFRLQEYAVNNPYRDQLINIDAAGEFLNNGGVHTADFDDLRGVARIIPHTAAARQCLADNYFRYVYGDAPGDAGALIISVRENLKNSGKLREALRLLGTSTALRYRKEHAR